ncbi:MAG: 50S ribosomal protein L32 [Nitrospiria bacterium]
MSQCRACAAEADGTVVCPSCEEKRLTCRVCSHEFSYRDIADDLPIVQCPICEGRAIEVNEG